MTHLIFELGVLVAGYWLTDKVVERTTGQHLHQHLFDWWCQMRDGINQWLYQNRHLGICRIGLIILDAFDDFVVRTKGTADWITLSFAAEDHHQRDYEIATCEISKEDALALFPDLQRSPVLVQELEV